ncbi:MAG: hypothetical protein K0Q51_1176 [Rickettsiaceae bacterium]|jgi:hypothetical protein|nr:hypothetical protein [Rickettsiaceae bacterium]
MDEMEFENIIQDLLQNNKQELNLSFKNLSLTQIQKLTEFLKTSKTVTKLNLSWCDIDEAGAKFIADALKQNKFITQIFLQRNNFKQKGAELIADAFKSNKYITIIDLSDNNLGAEGGMFIADALKDNSHIKKISLSGNYIGAEVMGFLADVLKNNTSITGIYLERNNLGDDGAESIAEALKINTSIKEIYLGGNDIGDYGANSIAEALKINTFITKFSLYDNLIIDQGEKIITEILKNNFTILEVKKVKSPEALEYLERNKKMLDTAFDHAYEYIYNGNNANIIQGEASLNPISYNDLFMLTHHKEEVMQKLAEKGITNYDNFAHMLRNYEEQNFFKLLGVGKSIEGSSLDALPSEILVKIMNFVSDNYRISEKAESLTESFLGKEEVADEDAYHSVQLATYAEDAALLDTSGLNPDIYDESNMYQLD